MIGYLKTEFEYELTVPFNYACKGEQIDAQMILLKAPTSRNSKECAFLKQAFFRALPKGDENAEVEDKKQDPDEIDGEGILILMAMSDKVDLGEVLEVARRLFTSGIAFVDGQEKLTKHLVDKMDQSDWESMLGAFMANFTVASALSKMNMTSSKVS